MKFSKASLLLAAGLCMAPGVHAQQSTADDAPKAHGAGITVGIDPATGRLRNLTPEEAATLERQRTPKRATTKAARLSAAPPQACAGDCVCASVG